MKYSWLAGYWSTVCFVSRIVQPIFLCSDFLAVIRAIRCNKTAMQSTLKRCWTLPSWVLIIWAGSNFNIICWTIFCFFIYSIIAIFAVKTTSCFAFAIIQVSTTLWKILMVVINVDPRQEARHYNFLILIGICVQVFNFHLQCFIQFESFFLFVKYTLCLHW